MKLPIIERLETTKLQRREIDQKEDEQTIDDAIEIIQLFHSSGKHLDICLRKKSEVFKKYNQALTNLKQAIKKAESKND